MTKLKSKTGKEFNTKWIIDWEYWVFFFFRILLISIVNFEHVISGWDVGMLEAENLRWFSQFAWGWSPNFAFNINQI